MERNEGKRNGSRSGASNYISPQATPEVAAGCVYHSFFGHLLNQAVFNPQSYTVNLTHN